MCDVCVDSKSNTGLGFLRNSPVDEGTWAEVLSIPIERLLGEEELQDADKTKIEILALVLSRS